MRGREAAAEERRSGSFLEKCPRRAGGRTDTQTDGRTGNSQVAVCLDLPRQVASEALKHPRVVRQEAVDLQAASDQHSVPGDLHRTDGHCVFVPHDVWLWRACTQEGCETGLFVSFLFLFLSFSH